MLVSWEEAGVKAFDNSTRRLIRSNFPALIAPKRKEIEESEEKEKKALLGPGSASQGARDAAFPSAFSAHRRGVF